MPEIEPMRNHLLAMGATHAGSVFETNLRFEDASKTLRQRGILLRLRKDDRIHLTLKSNLSCPDTQFKVHREWEIEVGDFDVCQTILEGLGFHAKQAYEKWRETFILDTTKLLIDTMPYGVFLEIEGEKSDIRSIAGQLGLHWEKRILLNYLEIFEVVQQEEGFSFSDITFSNFETTHFDIRRHLSLLYAG
ncbi:MAG: class IV adenylate cyclase [Desulfobacterales bacterium]|nr:MAG: class IV adenylate cyclase [Desulfobacterales bacterium]